MSEVSIFGSCDEVVSALQWAERTGTTPAFVNWHKNEITWDDTASEPEMDWELRLMNYNQTMSCFADSRVIFIGRFERALVRKSRYHANRSADLETHVAECLSHEYLHLAIFANAPGTVTQKNRACGYIDRMECEFSNPWDTSVGFGVTCNPKVIWLVNANENTKESDHNSK